MKMEVAKVLKEELQITLVLSEREMQIIINALKTRESDYNDDNGYELIREFESRIKTFRQD